jgi:hypothetical protein
MPEPAAAVAKARLVVFCFVPIEPPPGDAGEGRAYLQSIWDACGRLEMRHPIEALGLPVDLDWPSGSAGSYDAQLLAAREGRHPEPAVYQALAYVFHDVVALTAILAPDLPKDYLSRWDVLHAKWLGATEQRVPPPKAPWVRPWSFLPCAPTTRTGSRSGLEKR